MYYKKIKIKIYILYKKIKLIYLNIINNNLISKLKFFFIKI